MRKPARARRYDTSIGVHCGRTEGWVVGRFVVNAVSGVLAVASLLLPWKEQGHGSSLSAARLAATLTSGPTALPGGRLVAAFVYGVAVAGCALLMLSGAGGRVVALVRCGLGATLLAALAVVSVRGILPPDQWGSGPFLVMVAGSLAAATSAWTLVKGVIE